MAVNAKRPSERDIFLTLRVCPTFNFCRGHSVAKGELLNSRTFVFENFVSKLEKCSVQAIQDVSA